MEERWDVVVVGGGLAGLAAARTVVAAGKRVVVVEAHDVGGRARTSTHDGFRFNLGPRALYLGGAGHKVLRGFGIEARGGAPDGDRAHGLLNGELVRLPGTARSLLTTSLLGARGKVAIARLLGGLAKLKPRDYAHQTARAWLDMLRLPARCRGARSHVGSRGHVHPCARSRERRGGRRPTATRPRRGCALSRRRMADARRRAGDRSHDRAGDCEGDRKHRRRRCRPHRRRSRSCAPLCWPSTAHKRRAVF